MKVKDIKVGEDYLYNYGTKLHVTEVGVPLSSGGRYGVTRKDGVRGTIGVLERTIRVPSRSIKMTWAEYEAERAARIERLKQLNAEKHASRNANAATAARVDAILQASGVPTIKQLAFEAFGGQALRKAGYETYDGWVDSAVEDISDAVTYGRFTTKTVEALIGALTERKQA